MAEKKFSGIYPAFYACYDADGQVSEKRVRRFCRSLIEKGVQGLYIGGSSGECIYQSLDERKKTLEYVMAEAAGEIQILAHIGAPATKDSCELAFHAANLGVDALSSLPPYYFTLPDAAVEAYWNEIIAAGGMDFIIYNIPGTTQYHLGLPLYERMLENPLVIGIKNSSLPAMDIQKFKTAATAMGKEAVVFNGPDEQYIAGRMLGADAGIGGTYAAMPELFLAAEQAFVQGQNALALDIQNHINAIIYTALEGPGNMYAVFKEVLRRQDMDIGSVRSPLPPVSHADEAKVQRILDALAVARQRFTS